MVTQKVICRYCESDALIRTGSQNGKQQVKWKTCNKTFQLDYTYEACKASASTILTLNPINPSENPFAENQLEFQGLFRLMLKLIWKESLPLPTAQIGYLI